MDAYGDYGQYSAPGSAPSNGGANGDKRKEDDWDQYLDPYGKGTSKEENEAFYAAQNATCYDWAVNGDTRKQVLMSCLPCGHGLVAKPMEGQAIWHVLQPCPRSRRSYQQFLQFPMKPNSAFKVIIRKRGLFATVRVGLAPAPEEVEQRGPCNKKLELLGGVPGSVGYSVATGELWASNRSFQYGRALQDNDVLSCGLGSRGDVVFGINGKFLGGTFDMPFRSIARSEEAVGPYQFGFGEVAIYCDDQGSMLHVTVTGHGQKPDTYDVQGGGQTLRDIPSESLHKVKLYPTISVYSWGTVVQVEPQSSVLELSEITEKTAAARICKFKNVDGENISELRNLPVLFKRDEEPKTEGDGVEAEDEEETNIKSGKLEVWASSQQKLNLYIGYEGLEEGSFVVVKPKQTFGSSTWVLCNFCIEGLPAFKARLGIGPGDSVMVKQADIDWFEEVDLEPPLTFAFGGLPFNAETFWRVAFQRHSPEMLLKISWLDQAMPPGMDPQGFCSAIAGLLKTERDIPVVYGYLCLLGKDLDTISTAAKIMLERGLASRVPSTDFLQAAVWKPSEDTWMQAEVAWSMQSITSQAATELQGWLISLVLERMASESGASIALQCAQHCPQPKFLFELLETCCARVNIMTSSVRWPVLGDLWRLVVQSNLEKTALDLLKQSSPVNDALSQVAWSSSSALIPKGLSFDDVQVIELLQSYADLPKSFAMQQSFVGMKLVNWVEADRPGGVIAAFRTLRKVPHALTGSFFVAPHVHSSVKPPLDLALMNASELQEFLNYWGEINETDNVIERGLQLLVSAPPSAALASQVAEVGNPKFKEALAAMFLNHFRKLVPSVLVADAKLKKWNAASEEKRYAYEGSMVQSELNDRVEKSAYYWIADEWWNIWHTYYIKYGTGAWMKPVISGKPGVDSCISSDVFWNIFFEHFGTSDGIRCSFRESPSSDELLTLDNEQLIALYGLGKTELSELRDLSAIPELRQHIPEELQQVLSASINWMARLASQDVTGAEIQYLHEQRGTRIAAGNYVKAYFTRNPELFEVVSKHWSELTAFLKMAHEVSRRYPRAKVLIPPAQKAVERWQALLYTETQSAWSAWMKDLPPRERVERLQGLLRRQIFNEFCLRSDATHLHSETGFTWDAAEHILKVWDRVRHEKYETAAEIKTLFDVLNIDKLWAEKGPSVITSELREHLGEETTKIVLFTISLKRSRGFVGDILNTLKTFESVYPELQVCKGQLVDDLKQFFELSYDNPTPEMREKVARLEERHLWKWNDARCTYAKAIANGLDKIRKAHQAMQSQHFDELQRVVNGLPGMVEEQQVFQTLADMMTSLKPLAEPAVLFAEGARAVLDWLALPDDEDMIRLTAGIESLDDYLEVFHAVAKEWSTDEYEKNLEQAQATLSAMQVELRLNDLSIAQLQAIRPDAVEQYVYFHTESKTSYCFPDWTRFDQLKLVECRMLLYGQTDEQDQERDKALKADFRKLVSNLERYASLQLRMMQQGFLDLQLCMSLYKKEKDSHSSKELDSLVKKTTDLQAHLDSETQIIDRQGTFLPTTMLARVLRELKNGVTGEVPKSLQGLGTVFDLQKLIAPSKGTIAQQIVELDGDMRDLMIKQDDSRSMSADFAFPVDISEGSCSLVLYHGMISELFLVTAVFAKARNRLPRFYELLLYGPNSQVPREELHTFISRLQRPKEDELFLVGGWHHAPKEHQAVLRDKLPSFAARNLTLVFLYPDGAEVQPPSVDSEIVKNLAERNQAQAFLDGVGSLLRQTKAKFEGVKGYKSKYPGAGKSHRIQAQHHGVARLSLFHNYTTAALQESLQAQYESNKPAIWLNLSQMCPQQAELDLYRLLVCGLLSEPNAFPLAWKPEVPLLIEIPMKSDFTFLKAGIDCIEIRPPSEERGPESLWGDISVQITCKALNQLIQGGIQSRGALTFFEKGDYNMADEADAPKEHRVVTSSEEWACPRCTFLNASTRENCEMCGEGRPSRHHPSNIDPDFEKFHDIGASPAKVKPVPIDACINLLRQHGPKYLGKPAVDTSAVVLIQFCRYLESQFRKLHNTDVSMPQFDREAGRGGNLVAETMRKLVRNAAQMYEVALDSETFELSRSWGSDKLEPLLFLERSPEPFITVFSSPSQPDPSNFDWARIGACVNAVDAGAAWTTLNRVLSIPKIEVVLEAFQRVEIKDVRGARSLARRMNDEGEILEGVEVGGHQVEAGCTVYPNNIQRVKELGDMAITDDPGHLLPMFVLIKMNHVKKVLENVDDDFIVKNDFVVNGMHLRQGQVVRTEVYFPQSQKNYPALLEKISDIETGGHEFPMQLTVLEPEGALAQKGYVLTIDNVLKMVLVRFRLDHGPVMIMGETGCGKTSLIKYLCGVSGISLHVLDVHGGIEVQHVRDFMRPVLEEARSYLTGNPDSEPRQVWVFLDELNTSACVDFFAEMICDHCFDGDPLPENLRVLGASNPYRRAVKSSGGGTSLKDGGLRRADSTLFRTLSTEGLQRTRSSRGLDVKQDDLTLVYQVLPLPEKLRDFVWDFGSLVDIQRQDYTMLNKYIREMVKTHFRDPICMGGFAQLIVKSMKMLLRTEDVSCVSLRDARRAVTLACFYHEDCGIEAAHASVLAAAVCFYYRLGDSDERFEFLENASVQVNKNNNKLIEPFASASELIRKYQDDFTSIVDIPRGVARNESLTANLFVMFTAVSVKPPVPVFVVGKPGQSKTLAVSLLGSGRAVEAKFKVPLLSVLSYQCSEHTTAQGLDEHFEHGEILQEKRQGSRTAVRMVIFLDEVGLAEKNTRDRPLKVLHKRLEHPNVGFVGLSNTKLDASKMNRAIYLTHLDPGVNDLMLTSKAILRGQAEALEDSEVEHLASTISNLFMDYLERVQRYEDGRYSHLADFRGFYGLVKGMSRYVSRNHVPLSMHYTSPEVCDLFVRNLGGLPIPKELDELLLEPMCELEMAEAVKIWRRQTTYKQSARRMMDACLSDLDAQHLMVIAPDELYALRFLLYGDAPVLKRSETKVFFGSSFQEEKQSTLYVLELLSKIRLAMEVGQKVVLVNLGRLHESLYEVLNQQYIYFNGKPTCRVALGAESRQVPVHKDFRCVVVLTSGEVHPPAKKLHDDDQESIQRRFLSALLSRFEKVVISYEVEIPQQLKSTCEDLKIWIKGLRPLSQRGTPFVYHAQIPGAAEDLVGLMMVKKIHASQDDLNSSEPTEASRSVKDAIKDMMPPLTVLKAGFNSMHSVQFRQTIVEYMNSPWRTSLLAALELGPRLVVRTFDRVTRRLDREAQFHILHLSDFPSRASFQAALQEETGSTSLIIECIEADTPPAMLHDCYDIMQGESDGSTESLLDKWDHIIFLLQQKPFTVGPRVTADFGPEWRHCWVDELLQDPSNIHAVPVRLEDLSQTPAQLLKGPKASLLFRAALQSFVADAYVSYPAGTGSKKEVAQHMIRDEAFIKIARERLVPFLVKAKAFQSWDKLLENEYPQGVQQPLTQAVWRTLESNLQSGFADFWAALDAENNVNSYTLQEEYNDVRVIWRALARNDKLVPFSLQPTVVQRPCVVTGQGSMFPFTANLQRWLGHVRPELVAHIATYKDSKINERFSHAFEWIRNQAIMLFSEVQAPAPPTQPQEVKSFLVESLALAVAPNGLHDLLTPVAVVPLAGLSEEGWEYVAAIVAAVFAAEHVFLSDSASVGCWLVLKRILDSTNSWSKLCKGHYLPESLIDELFKYGLEGLKAFATQGEAIKHLDLAHIETAFRTFKSVEKIPLTELAYAFDMASILVRTKACADLALCIGEKEKDTLKEFAMLVLHSTARNVGEALIENLEFVASFVQAQWRCRKPVMNLLAKRLGNVKIGLAGQIKRNPSKCSALTDLMMQREFPPNIAMEIMEEALPRPNTIDLEPSPLVEELEKRLQSTPYEEWQSCPLVLSIFLLFESSPPLQGLAQGKPCLERLLAVHVFKTKMKQLREKIAQWLEANRAYQMSRWGSMPSRLVQSTWQAVNEFDMATARLESDETVGQAQNSTALKRTQRCRIRGLEGAGEALNGKLCILIYEEGKQDGNGDGEQDGKQYEKKTWKVELMDGSTTSIEAENLECLKDTGVRRWAIDRLDDDFTSEVVRKELWMPTLLSKPKSESHLLVPTLLTSSDVQEQEDFFSRLPTLAQNGAYATLSELLNDQPHNWDFEMRKILQESQYPTLLICSAALAAKQNSVQLSSLTDLVNRDALVTYNQNDYGDSAVQGFRGLDNLEMMLLESISKSNKGSFLGTGCRATMQRGSDSVVAQDVEKLIVCCLAAALEMSRGKEREHPVLDFMQQPSEFSDKYLWGMSTLIFYDSLTEIKADPVYANQLTRAGYEPIYCCPNEHPYWLRNCSNPWVVYNCTFCDEQIGGTGHRLVARNRRVPRPEWSQPHVGYNFSRYATSTDELQPQAFQALKFWTHSLLVGALSVFPNSKDSARDYLPKHFPMSRAPLVEDVMSQCVESLIGLMSAPGAAEKRRDDHVLDLALLFADVPGLSSAWSNQRTQMFQVPGTALQVDRNFASLVRRTRKPVAKASAHQSLGTKEFQVTRVFLSLPPIGDVKSAGYHEYSRTLEERRNDCPTCTLLLGSMSKLLYVTLLPDLLAILRVLYASYNGGRLSKAEAQKMPLEKALGPQRCKEMWKNFSKAWNSMRHMLEHVECANVHLMEMGPEPPQTLSWFVCLDRGEGLQLWSLVEKVAGYQNDFIRALPFEQQQSRSEPVDVLQFDQRFAVGGGDVNSGATQEDGIADTMPVDEQKDDWMAATLPVSMRLPSGRIVYDVEPFEAAAKIAVAPLRCISLKKPDFKFADHYTDWKETLEAKMKQVQLPKAVHFDLEHRVGAGLLDRDAVSALRLLVTKCVYQLLSGVGANAGDRLCDFAEQERLAQYGATFPGELREVRLQHLADFWTVLIEYWEADFEDMIAFEYRGMFDPESPDDDQAIYRLWQDLQLWPDIELRKLSVGFKILFSDKLCEKNMAESSPMTYALAAAAYPEEYDLPLPFPRDLPLSNALGAYEYVKLALKRDGEVPEAVKRVEELLTQDQTEELQRIAEEERAQWWGPLRPARDGILWFWRGKWRERRESPAEAVQTHAMDDASYWANRGYQ